MLASKTDFLTLPVARLLVYRYPCILVEPWDRGGHGEDYGVKASILASSALMAADMNLPMLSLSPSSTVSSSREICSFTTLRSTEGRNFVHLPFSLVLLAASPN